MPKRKSSTNTNNKTKKISLENITGIGGMLESMETYKKASQTDKYFEDEKSEYFFLLEQIADDLELSENFESDEAEHRAKQSK